MFRFPWRKRKDNGAASPSPERPELPELHPDNPAQSPHLVLHDDEGRAPDLTFDLVDLLLRVMKEESISAKRHGDSLELDNGLILQPGFLSLQSIGKHMRCSTVIQVNHPSLCPNGLFEFQHANGTTPEDAFLNGFRNWTWMDLVALSAALLDEPGSCLTMRLELADGRTRRVVFSPFSHFMSDPPEAGTPAAEEVEKYCPCCLFSAAHEAFRTPVEQHGTVGIRMYACVHADGAQADCRIDGVDHPDGAAALLAYASSWLPKGDIEFRKQYVVVHDWLPT